MVSHPKRVRSALAVLLAAGLSLALPVTASAQPAPPEAAKPAKPAKPAPKPAKPAPEATKPTPDPSTTVASPEQPAIAGQPSPSGAPPAAPAPPAPGQPPGDAPPAEPSTPSDEPLIVPQETAPPAIAPEPAAPAPKEEPPRPAANASGDVGARPSEIYAEDWWSHARPTFEFHGYFRVRAELFHNFALGRFDAPGNQIWPQPADNAYADLRGNTPVALCGDTPLSRESCEDDTQAGANMRFRLNPELHISDNLRVLSQIDLLDNLVLGSTPDGYSNQPGGTGSGYRVVQRGGYSPAGAFASTQWAPSAGQNSTSDSIVVKRVWGEYLTPVGLLRFGRMPSHWGLGMLVNGGDGHDQDYGSTADRIMLVTGIKQYDLYFAGAWDFANEGATSAQLDERQGQAYDLAQLDDVNQYVLMAVRRRNPELQRLELARGDVVMNGGVYFAYRNQVLANDSSAEGTSASLGAPSANVTEGYIRRGAEMVVPDLWFQLLYDKFRFEIEAAMMFGSLETTSGSDYANAVDSEDPGWKIRQFGLTAQSEFRAIEDRLRIQFGFGYASGDDDVESLIPQGEGLEPQLTTAERTFSTFRFHPAYNVDLILFRNLLSRVQGAYYFRPSVDYDFARDKNGQRLGGGAAVIWSRASEFVQTPGNKRDLGIELNFQLYYQSKDGTLNDNPDKMGGFFTSLQYGVMFPLGGFDYLPGEVEDFANAGIPDVSSDTAQTLRWYMGVLF